MTAIRRPSSPGRSRAQHLQGGADRDGGWRCSSRRSARIAPAVPPSSRNADPGALAAAHRIGMDRDSRPAATDGVAPSARDGQQEAKGCSSPSAGPRRPGCTGSLAPDHRVDRLAVACSRAVDQPGVASACSPKLQIVGRCPGPGMGDQHAEMRFVNRFRTHPRPPHAAKILRLRVGDCPRRIEVPMCTRLDRGDGSRRRASTQPRQAARSSPHGSCELDTRR